MYKCCQRGCTVAAARNGCYRGWRAGPRTECRSHASRFPKCLDRTRENFHQHSLEPGDHRNKTQTKTCAHTAHASTSTIERSHARAKQRKAPIRSAIGAQPRHQPARKNERALEPGWRLLSALLALKQARTGISCGSCRTRSRTRNGGRSISVAIAPRRGFLLTRETVFFTRESVHCTRPPGQGEQREWSARRCCCCVQ